MSERLTIVLGPHGQVQDLREGRVSIAGVTLDFVEVKRMPDAYRDMARSQPYDICEMAPTAYLIAKTFGAPITALPLPMTRRFRHQGLICRQGKGINGPKDLEGRTVGVRAYGVTAAVWTRGILAEDYGLDVSRVRWLTEEDENVPGTSLPANVEQLPAGQHLSERVVSGELDAGFAGLAGLGAAPTGEWTDVVNDAQARERDWYARTGIYPLHGVIVVRDAVLARHPGLAKTLFEAFVQARDNYLERIESGQASEAEDLRYQRLGEWMGNPLPYGLEENAASFAALVRYVHQQGLIPHRPALTQVFPDPRMSVHGEQEHE